MATRLKIKTTEGDIIIRLYDETPKHRDNGSVEKRWGNFLN